VIEQTKIDEQTSTTFVIQGNVVALRGLCARYLLSSVIQLWSFSNFYTYVQYLKKFQYYKCRFCSGLIAIGQSISGMNNNVNSLFASFLSANGLKLPR
jgi:hypothetical protein